MRGAKIINYSTPKYVQLRRKQAQPYTAAKKSSSFCVPLKGSHVFVLKDTQVSTWFQENNSGAYEKKGQMRYDYLCQGCKKKKTEYQEFALKKEIYVRPK